MIILQQPLQPFAMELINDFRIVFKIGLIMHLLDFLYKLGLELFINFGMNEYIIWTYTNLASIDELSRC